jgi:hypothetical protein
MHATCLVYLIVCNLITLVIAGAEYKLCSSSLCNFLPHPIISSLLG